MPHRVKIYQINTDRDKERLIFAGSDVLMKNKLPCLSILKTVSMLQEDRKNPVRVSLANDKIVFNYRGANSQYEDECAVSAAESAESVMIGLNNSYLQETLNACPADTIKVQYDGALSPVLFRSKSEQAEIVQVVVPMRLAAE